MSNQEIKKGNQSNYEITITLSSEQLDGYKGKALEQFQQTMNLPGFRKGHVPLKMVEESVQPEYLRVAMIEEAVNASLRKLIEEHKDLQFIGQAYGLRHEDQNGGIVISYKLDVYPNAEVSGDGWKKIKTKQDNGQTTEEEVATAFENLKKQYATYENRDTIANNTFAKVRFTIHDVSGNEIDKGTLYLEDADFKEFPILEKHFVGQKLHQESEIPYNTKGLPATLQVKKEGKPETIKFTVLTIQETLLPAFSEDEIQKFFGNENIKTKDDLVARIKEVISEQKKEQAITKAVEDLIKQAQEHIKITLPATIIEEELSSRMKNMAQRMGGEQGFKAYLEKIGEEETKKLLDEVRTSSQQSLEKYFIFRKLTELFELKDINRNTPLDAETKLLEAIGA